MTKDFIKRFPMFLKFGVKNRKFLQLIFTKIHQNMDGDFLERLETCKEEI